MFRGLKRVLYLFIKKEGFRMREEILDICLRLSRSDFSKRRLQGSVS